MMMTSAQVVEASVNVTINSPSQDYTLTWTIILHQLMTPGLKPFREIILFSNPSEI